MKKFELPKIEITVFTADDIVTASGENMTEVKGAENISSEVMAFAVTF